MSILISVNGLAFKDKPIFNNAAVIEKKLKKINQLQFIVKFVSSYQLRWYNIEVEWPNFCNSLPHPRNPQIFLETCPFIQTGIN